jgi:hypothetical protein
MASRILAGLKFLRQFGLRPLALYGLYKVGLLTGHYQRMERGKMKETPLSSFLFPLPARDQLQTVLGEEGKAALLKEADEIVNGQVRVFGELTPLDFSHNQPLQHWTAYETNHRLLSSFIFHHNDIKYLWEPARFAFAFTLGRAYHLTQDERYAESFWKHFESFTQHNPPNMGPHWMNGQEVAVRMLSLVWAYHVFAAAPASSAERSDALLHSIYQHAGRIPPTLVYARSQNNNHLVTEAAAIYTAGLFFKDPTWRALGWKWLNWSLQNQIGDFGEYIQHSTNYHRLMLQTALWIHFIKQDVFPSATTQALARSIHWLFSILDNASGSTPNLGANDGALIFPLSGTSFNDFRPTVQAASRAFLRNSLNSGIWDELSLWFGLKETKHVVDSNAYLTDNLRSKNSWGYLRASSFKSRLSHMDQMHFDLWWRGLNVAQDAGTYLYNAAPPWDNPLVTSRVHNVLTMDGKEQMTRGGRFLVLDWANAFGRPVVDYDEKILHKMKAYFTGWRRYGIAWERTVALYTDEFWEVQDRLLNWWRRPHTYRLHWLLIDGKWKVESKEGVTTLQVETSQGTVQLVTRYPSTFPVKISIVRAGEVVYGERNVQPYEGWVSRHYGEKSPALSFALELTSSYHTTITSEFSFLE